MTTVLTEQGPVEVAAGPGAEDQLWLTADDTETVSGWTMRREGLCRGDICVPVPGGAAEDYLQGDSINLAAFWRLMEKPFGHSRDGETWAFGEAAGDRSARLKSLQAADFSLPDLDGALHGLSDFRGKKVFLATWASW